MVTPAPQSYGQVLRGGKPELHCLVLDIGRAKCSGLASPWGLQQI